MVHISIVVHAFISEIQGEFMKWLFFAIALRAVGESHVPVGVLVMENNVVPILWNSTLILDESHQDKDLAVCKRGDPEDCKEGLSYYTDSREGQHRCDILTDNCKCHQWVFLEPPARTDGVVLKRSSEHPSCVVIQLPQNMDKDFNINLALEFRLRMHENKFLTLGAQAALESIWNSFPVNGKVQKSLFVASEANQFCDNQQIDYVVPDCNDNPPFLLNIRYTNGQNTVFWYWPVWVPLLVGLGGLVLQIYVF